MQLLSVPGKFKNFTCVIVAMFISVFATAQQQDDRPNILWIVSEDNTTYIGAYGDVYATTPNIDALAKQGILFEDAYCTAPVCAPSRSTLITGMYPPAVGTENMRSEYPVPAFVKFFPRYLREAGYYTSNNAKKDYNTVDQTEAWDESGNKATYKNRRPGQPFFAVFNINTTHESSIFGNEVRRQMTAEFTKKPLDSIQLPPEKPLIHDPEKIHIPPYLPATREMKHDWALYYDKIQQMDSEVGTLLKELDEAGLADNTIVFYYGDNGGVLGRSKRFIFESGLHIPLVVRIPEKFRKYTNLPAGSRTKQLVDFTDFAPTVLSLAGIQPPAYLQGKAFLGKYAVTKQRDIVFNFRGRMDEGIDLVRSVRDRQYRYVKNFMPHRKYGQHIEFLWLASNIRSWEKAYNEGTLNEVQSRFFNPKPAEELYDVIADPDNIHNLAGKPGYEKILDTLRKETFRLLVEIKDVGFIPEPEAERITATTTLYDYARSGNYDISKVLETAIAASSNDKKQLSYLIKKSAVKDPVIRYWAATGLLALGKDAQAAKPVLQKLLKDEKRYIGTVAAEALYHLGDKQDALQHLYKAVKDSSVMSRLQALIALQAATPEELVPVAGELEQITKNKTEYDKKAARYLLKRIAAFSEKSK
ncbi:MAG: sulfatase-like hydrolase/transferase [Agriterribacter sp.]